MNLFKKTLAGVLAMSMAASAVPFAGMGIAAVQASAQDISSTMEWGTLRIGGGGFVSGIVAGKDVMYARTDVGGAYKYNYDTESWEQLFGFINEADRGLLSVDAMAIDPTDDDTVYFLCGCAYFSSEKTVIFKTTDGGKTFTEIDVTSLIKVMGNGDGRQCGESIAVDPDNPNIIYAGGDVMSDDKSLSALIKSTDGGKTWKPVIGYDDLGLFSTTCKWPTWGNVNARSVTADAYNNQNGVANIAIVGGKVYVGTSIKGVANVHVANVKDDKYSVLSKDLPTNVFPSRINVDANGDLLISYIAGLAFNGASGGAYRYSPKTGKVSELFDTNFGLGSVWADPNNPDHLIAGSCGKWQSQLWQAWTEEHGPAWGDQYFRSFDGGKTWQNFSPGQTHGWNQPLVSNYLQDGGYSWIVDKAIHWSGTVVTDPRNSDRMFITSGNGVFICENLWSTDQDKLPTFTFHPDGIEEVVSLDFVSTADGLDLSAIGDYDGFVHEKEDKIGLQYQPNMGSTSAIAVCPQNTDVWARTANGDGNNTGSAYYTLDRGKTWTAFTPACTGGKLSITELKKGTYRIINTSANGAVSYSDDFGKTWNKSSGIDASKTVYTLVDPKDPSIVYASGVKYNEYWASDMTKKEPTLDECHYSFYISTDYGKTFTAKTVCRYDMCDSSGDPAYLGDGSIIVAGGWYGMYKVSNKGASIEKLDNVFYAKTVGYGAPEKTGGLNTLYMYGRPAESDPEGIYRSTDGGKSWDCINTDHLYGGTGNGNYLVGDMDEFGKVYMSTVGCGIVYGKLTSGSTTPTDDERIPKISAEALENSVKLSWNKMSDATKYAVYGYQNGKWVKIDETSSTSYTVKNLTAGKSYKFAVVTYAKGRWYNNYAYPNAVTVTPKAASSVTYPTNIKVNYSEQYHQMQFVWDKVSGADRYGIAVYLAGKWRVQTSNITTNSFVTPKNLTPGMSYKVAIAARVDGKWDTTNALKNAVTVTVK
ncbi:MAG: 1,4-beta-glucanase [Ruminococcus sp.]|uniref:fibronectin type III domain-containing protein n=1 Tax=Ruminococcus sp. TaxID=41978 RepID=UPI0025F98A00|nr:1,4-beta-glucanase [Ruminococcus sp.]MCR5541994.1 1,4-beta-glucanase [Ruminococcus sp.]